MKRIKFSKLNQFWCDFDRASSSMCGNKMPTRYKRWFLLQILLLAQHVWAPLCPSSGAREYYTGGCCLWYLVLWFSSCRYGVELRVVCPGCELLVSGTIMPIIRSSEVLYRWLLPVVFGVLVFKLSVWCGAEGYVSGLRAAAADDGHNGARNMLSKQ
jgi:hypothetical protein